MYVLSFNMWFQKLIIQLFFWIDKIVYNFIPSVYDLLISIARTSILTQSDIATFSDRIYKLLAIFMIFKVTFSLIMYIVNPDDFTDKTKGVSKLGTNIVISLALLILTPYIFNYAYELQTAVIESNTLAALIMGEEDDGNVSFLNSAGDEMSFVAMSAFFTPNLSLPDLYNCATLVKRDGTKTSFDSDCEAGLRKIGKNTTTLSDTMIDNYVAGVENNSLGLTFRQDLALATDKDKNADNFVMDYKPIFSTAVGICIVLILITFCMDIAVRSIKLAFLQLVAPIPIISYVDPKSGKDGLFKKWYQMCFKTYLSLFIRLIALYFAVYVISKVAKMKMVDIIDGSYQTNLLLSVFIIIGALMFAKQLPKILEGLGIKLDGDGKFSLNPLRKMENEMLGGKYLKKPNDALASFAKDGFGAKTLAKKTISGIDAARHGKGFKNGFDRYKGGFGKWWDKQKESYLPYSFESGKERKQGKEEVATMSSKWSKGKEIYDEMVRAGIEKPFDALNGSDRSAYEKAGFEGEFLTSKMNFDYASEQKKILDRIADARRMGTSITEIITAEKDNLDAYGIDIEKIKNDTTLSKMVSDTDKKVSGLEKVHESMRKQYQKQADMEDAFKFVKYNRTDPTDPNNPERTV